MVTQKIGFFEEDRTDKPLSFYAASKKANEVMAYSYSELYNIKSVCIRFFSIYGTMVGQIWQFTFFKTF